MSGPRRERVLAVLFAGVLIGALDIAIVGPALPSIQETFGVDSRALSWVFNVYVLFQLIGAPLLGKLSDRLGRRSVYVLSLTLFALGSLVVALAPVFEQLLLGRALQAFGAGGMFPIASAVIADVFPPERRGRFLGLIGAVFGLAFLIGPLLGGVLLDWGWRWLFLVNLPVTGVVIWQALRTLPGAAATEPRPFDLPGAVTLSILLAALAGGVSELDVSGLGASLRSAPVLFCLGLIVLAAPLLWRIERRAEDPVLNPAFFTGRQLRVVAGIALAAGVAEAGMVFLPSMAVAGFEVQASTASLMMMPLVLTLVIGAPAAGRLLERIGAKRIVQLGLLLVSAGLAVFALPELTLVSFYGAGICVGFGLAGLLGAPLRYIVLREAGEARRGVGQGLLTICLGVGQLAGAAVVGSVAAASREGVVAGYQSALLTVAIATLAALALSTALSDADDPLAARPAGAN